MKLKNNKWMRFVFALLIMGNLISCEEEADTYRENSNILNSDIGLQYENMLTFSYQEELSSVQPMFNIDKTQYAFSILGVKVDGELLKTGLSIFTIDTATGVVKIDNTKGGLVPGQVYNFDIGVENVNGVIRNDDAFVLSVANTPLDYTITNDTYDAKFLEVGEVATVTYVDTSENGDVLDDITYSLSNPPIGFSIDSETGVVSKNTDATFGDNVISVTIGSNLGAKSFESVLTVTVGEAPTLTYVQLDGSTTLTNAVLSPWTVYTTANPVMEGMNAVSYEIIFPETITAGGIVVDNNGSITVLSDQNLPLGVHSLGVIATNSGGISATFENRFTITIETRWEVDAPVFFEDFNNAVDPPEVLNDYNAALTSYMLNSGIFDFKAAYTSSKGVYTAKLGEGKVGGNFESPSDGTIVLELAMQADWRKMRVSFNEGFGYGDNRIGWYERTLQSSHDITDLISGTYDDSNWTTMMSDADTDWSGTSVWKGLSSDNDLNKVGFKDVELTQGSAAVYLNWRVQKTGTATGGAAFLVDDIRVEVSLAFEAEEQ